MKINQTKNIMLNSWWWQAYIEELAGGA